MLRIALFFLPFAGLMACTNPDEIVVDCGEECHFDLWVNSPYSEPIPELNIEFLEPNQEPGSLGWHLEMTCEDGIFLETSVGGLQDLLETSGENVIAEEVECVRWNVTYGNGRWLCEETDDGFRLITDTSLSWGDQDLSVTIWEDPYGNGCSALACR
ncbi:MAG: hypothetical protein P8J32_00050 [bacterium]|nr:hypothetical protein [bacterium]